MSLFDQWRRRIARLRLAVSNSCNFRCVCCRPRFVAGRFPVTADGFLRSRLFSSEEQYRRPALAAAHSNEALTAAFLAAAAHKPSRPLRTISAIGG